MGQGYQDRDHEIIDYRLWRHESIGRPLRGPDPGQLVPGRFVAAIGAAQTFGCYVERPYPALVGDALSLPAINLGVAGAGPLFFASHRAFLAVARRAALVIVQVMSGRSESNSVFESRGGELLTRRADGTRQGAEPSYRALLEEAPADVIDDVVEETRRNWIDNYRTVLAALDDVPVVLLWMSERGIDYERSYDDVFAFFGQFPQLVDPSWLGPLVPLADGCVEVVSSRGMPQPLVSRFTGEPASIQMRADLGGKRKTVNNYYPSPEMHEDAATALVPVCRRLLADA